jgi:hypothetical protein
MAITLDDSGYSSYEQSMYFHFGFIYHYSYAIKYKFDSINLWYQDQQEHSNSQHLLLQEHLYGISKIKMVA